MANKVTAVIAHSQFIVDSSSKLGAVDLTDTPSYQNTGIVTASAGNGLREDSQIIPFSYTVPDGRIATIQSIQIYTGVSGTWEDGNVGGDFNRQGGTAFVKIDGSTVSEEALWIKLRVQSGGTSTQLSDTSGGGGPFSAPKAGRVVPFGDGIQLTNGQVLSITYNPTATPNSVTFPHTVHAWFHAIDTVSGAVITKKTELFPDTTSGQTVLTYTVGSNGITLKNWFVWAEGSPPIYLESQEVYLNSAKIAEIPVAVSTLYKSKGVNITFPLWGLTIGARSVIEVRIRPWVALGQLINVVLYGEVIQMGYPRQRARW